MNLQTERKKSYPVFIAAFMIISFLAFSCKEDNKSNCTAGTGGIYTIAAFPKHHDDTIYSQPGYLDTAYVKFNTHLFPGYSPADYDLVIAGEEGENHVHIKNLKCGDYFIYMTGWDTSFNGRVTGGIPYSLPESGPTDVDVVVPVSE